MRKNPLSQLLEPIISKSDDLESSFNEKYIKAEYQDDF